jgi:PEP-CTERM motif
MSKSLAVTAQAASRPAAMAVALASVIGVVAIVAVAPAPAWAKSNKPPSSSNGNGNGNSGAQPAPVVLPVCALSDLSPGAAACSGFFQGNLLNNSSPDVAAQLGALNAIGLSNWDGSLAEPQLNLSSSLVDFQTALNGVTWIGIHFGAGTNSPSPQTPGGVTGFYRFDAGANLASFLLSYGSASAARLYATGSAPVIPPPVTTPTNDPVPPSMDPPPGNGGVGAVPEPATWAMMILGFGAAGALLRRRRAALA